ETQSRLQNVTSVEAGSAGLPAAQVAAQAAVQTDQLRISNLKKLRASGRVALGLDPDALVLPALALEDGDAIHVPNVPAFVGVFGAVQNENVLLWKDGISTRDVIRQAGLTTFADPSELYVLRADGTVQGGSSGGLFAMLGAGSHTTLMPGDTVVVPEKADRETGYTAFIRGAKDWTSILAQFGLGAAAIKTLRN
ncbi:MAG: hypothetical protein ACR2I0_09195, partial [Rhodoferax sp.]